MFATAFVIAGPHDAFDGEAAEHGVAARELFLEQRQRLRIGNAREPIERGPRHRPLLEIAELLLERAHGTRIADVAGRAQRRELHLLVRIVDRGDDGVGDGGGADGAGHARGGEADVPVEIAQVGRERRFGLRSRGRRHERAERVGRFEADLRVPVAHRAGEPLLQRLGRWPRQQDERPALERALAAAAAVDFDQIGDLPRLLRHVDHVEADQRVDGFRLDFVDRIGQQHRDVRDGVGMRRGRQRPHRLDAHVGMRRRQIARDLLERPHRLLSGGHRRGRGQSRGRQSRRRRHCAGRARNRGDWHGARLTGVTLREGADGARDRGQPAGRDQSADHDPLDVLHGVR